MILRLNVKLNNETVVKLKYKCIGLSDFVNGTWMDVKNYRYINNPPISPIIGSIAWLRLHKLWKSGETGLGGERQYDDLDFHVCGKSRSRCNCKAVFTRYRHQLLLLLHQVDMPRRTQIRTQVRADGSHFGLPKITFNRISRHFRSIHNFFFRFVFTKWPLFQINTQLFFLNFLLYKMAPGTKWPPAAILDDRKSLSIAFLAITDQYATFWFSFSDFLQNQ